MLTSPMFQNQNIIETLIERPEKCQLAAQLIVELALRVTTDVEHVHPEPRKCQWMKVENSKIV